MNDEVAFIRAILTTPDGEGLRSVYADWLEERGDLRGEFLRLTVALRGMPPDDVRSSVCRARLQELRPSVSADWIAAACTRTALLRYSNPTDIPAYGGWDFEVLGALIVLRAEDVRDEYAAYLDHHHRFHSNIPEHWQRYAEFHRVTKLHDMLVRACGDGRDVTLDGHDYVWSFTSELMFDKRFVSVDCPQCHRSLRPADCQVLEWSFGVDLAAEGGRRVVCPAGHTLYSCMEWNS